MDVRDQSWNSAKDMKSKIDKNSCLRLERTFFAQIEFAQTQYPHTNSITTSADMKCPSIVGCDLCASTDEITMRWMENLSTDADPRMVGRFSYRLNWIHFSVNMVAGSLLLAGAINLVPTN